MRPDEALRVMREYADSCHSHRIAVCGLTEQDTHIPDHKQWIETAKGAKVAKFKEDDK